VHTRPRCATRCRCEIHCAHAAKLCYTSQAAQHDTAKFCNTPPMQNSLCTRGQDVQHAADAKFTVHTRPSCATRRKLRNTIRPSSATRRQCKIHCAHAANALCTRDQAVLVHAASCATRCGQVLQKAADAKFTVHMRPMHCAHAAKLYNTLQSCATRCRCEIHCAHAAKMCNTLPMRNSLCTRGQVVLHAASCATRYGQVLQHAANAKFTVHTPPSCAT
jgi:phage gpG-like protein